MPKLTRWAIRAALGYLWVGLAGWMLATANQYDYLGGTWFALRPVSFHFIAVGWLTQLIFAVMYWMFPIISRAHPHGNPKVSWAGFILLNLGLILRAIFEIGLTRGWHPDWGWGLVASALLQWAGVTLLVGMSWRRVRERAGK